MRDRRFELRQRASEQATIRWEEPAQTKEIIADLAEISPSGARFRLKHPLRVHSAITVTHSNKQKIGKVRYCVAGIGGFVIGVQFETL